MCSIPTKEDRTRMSRRAYEESIVGVQIFNTLTGCICFTGYGQVVAVRV